MEELSLLLWRERELLDTLLFKLELEQLVLSSGRTRWLARSAREVEAALEAIRETEVLRAGAADAVAAELGLDPDPSLKALADAAGEPWSTILHEHRDAFLTVTGEIRQLADTNRELITSGQRAAREMLMDITEKDTYREDGGADTSAVRPRYFDQDL